MKALYALFEVTKGSFIKSVENDSTYILIKISSSHLNINLKSNIILSKKINELSFLKNNLGIINCFEINLENLKINEIQNFDNIFKSSLIHLIPRVHQKDIISISDVILFLSSKNYISILQELTIEDVIILDTQIVLRIEEILRILKLLI
ncbi:MAG: hypothetical protein LAT82_04400 [Nanoarchaeota archaeon]|nr:hypothetical protein [Nanoarchaeota archaeon]